MKKGKIRRKFSEISSLPKLCTRRTRSALFGSILMLLCFFPAGCASASHIPSSCTILFEDNDSIWISKQVWTANRSQDFSVSVGVPKGSVISSVSYEDYSVSPKTGSSESYDYYTLTLYQVRFGTVIRIETASSPQTFLFHTENGDLTLSESKTHLYPNAPAWKAEYCKTDCAAIGWNTKEDGSGTHIGFGSRIDFDASGTEFYPEYFPFSSEADFLWEQEGDSAVITGLSEEFSESELVIPSVLGGLSVTGIKSGAFVGLSLSDLILPPSLYSIEENAFSDCEIEELTLYDNLLSVSDPSFFNCQITHLHINAATDPVWSGTYFDTFNDKFDYLESVKDEQKILLFAGSSARFGYDSETLEAAFPGYRVVNLGVYAYANMLPEAELLSLYLQEGDIVLSSPELDAIDCQFCGEAALSSENFCMAESDYDRFALLDCTKFTGLFDALGAYLNTRSSMSARSYEISASSYDEDGNPCTTASYNRYGDYILYRANNLTGKTFGVKRAFLNANHIRECDWEGLCSVYSLFLSQGAEVYYTWSPRSRISLSEDSTEESIKELEEILKARLNVPVISSVWDCLMDPLYFYGTDNHLSTSGAALHTEQIIRDLKAAREGRS